MIHTLIREANTSENFLKGNRSGIHQYGRALADLVHRLEIGLESSFPGEYVRGVLETLLRIQFDLLVASWIYSSMMPILLWII